MNYWKQFWKPVHYLHFALIPMETDFFDNFWNRQYLNNSGVNFQLDCVPQKSKPTIFFFQQKTDKLQNVHKKKENGTKTCYLKSIPPATTAGPQIE